MAESFKDSFTHHIHELQDRICDALASHEPAQDFQEDHWDRPGGGGGRTRVLAEGAVIEKGGVNTSTVHGELPETIRQNFGVEDGWFHAAGLSLVVHPRNPHVPTVHANFRYFELYDHPDATAPRDAWFGGGADLTPYYLVEEDARHFHAELKVAADSCGTDLYPRFKAACDAYFHNTHRGERRGIGGLFYDYLRADDDRSLADWHAFTRAQSEAFLPAYLPILARRKTAPWTANQRRWQEIRRGRYVEFNLLWDRGTKFGIQSEGRTESILMSLPPVCQWHYQHEPAAGTPEAALLAVLRQPRAWV